MKLKQIIAVAALSLLVACETPYRATDTTIVVAPDGTQTEFVTRYPGASNVVWSHYDNTMVVPVDWELAGWTVLDESDYTVRFLMDDEDYYAFYDENGEWIGTAYVVRDHSTMPSAINTMLSSNYPAYTISSVNRQFQVDRTAYEIELKNSNTKVKLLVDANGNIIKQKTKSF
jgi:hypothetical protein